MRQFVLAAAAVAIVGWAASVEAAQPRRSGEIAVTVTNVENNVGRILVGLCTRDTFLGPRCPYREAVRARRGSVRIIFRDIPPGQYAIQAMHDTNDNNDLDRNALGLPTEGVGISNNPLLAFGPPSFEEAAFDASADPGRVVLKYFH